MSKKLLIIGGTGFLGYHVAKKAIKKKWVVHSFSSKNPKKKRLCKNVKYIICDITNKKKIYNNLKIKYDFIINLGGYVDHANKKKTFLSHYKGCKYLVDILQKKNLIPIKFIQIGTSIENLKIKSPQTEVKPYKNFKIQSTYAKSKLLASIFLINLYAQKKFPAVILRPYIVYGPKQDPNRFIPFVIDSCKKNKKFELSDCKQARDFLHVQDFVNLIFKIFKSNSKTNGDIYNVGFGKATILKQIVEFIKKEINSGYPEYGKFKLRPDEIKILYPKINKTKKTFKWKPKVKLFTGLKKLIDQN